jgi:pilus assembly protein CpaF
LLRPMNQNRGLGGRQIPEEYFELKTKIHDRLLDSLDLTLIETMERDALRHQLRSVLEDIIREETRAVPLNLSERERLFQEIQDEVLGLGPLEPFLQDPSVSDILVNTYNQIYVERYGKLEFVDARFKDNTHLKRIIDKIVSSVGRRIDESSPMVDARLQDGSRVNAIIPPLSIDGPILSIRRFSVDPLEMSDLLKLKTVTPEIADLLTGCIRARLNILISGGTGSGKTTTLNVLSRFISNGERIVTIEDSAELQLQQNHVVRLETRPPNVEGKGEITQRDLVRNSLRMRPDRIILGEVRGGEAFDMLQAMNTGHEGSITTIHANTPRDALMRLESMIAMGELDIPALFMRRFIASAIDVVIQINRFSDGTRKVVSMEEVSGMDGGDITLQKIFSFRQRTIDETGQVRGRFQFEGVRPRFIDKFQAAGLPAPPDMFDPSKSIEI